MDIGIQAKPFLDSLGRSGPWGPVLLIGCYVVGAIFFVPGLVLTLVSGALFGVGKGCVVASIGSTLGATGAFLVGRYLLRRRLTRRLEGTSWFAAIDRQVTADGWKIVGLARLSPLLPYVMLNYAFALTRISLRDYVIASWIGMLPATALYAYLGSLAQAASGQRVRTTGEWILYAVGLVATLVLVIYLTRVAREALNRKVKIGD